jgi:hypothetical protein
MIPKCSVPIGLLKLPGMSAIQAALQSRSAGTASSATCKSSKDRGSLASWQRGVVPPTQPPRAALIGTRSQPVPVQRHSVTLVSGNHENQQHNTGMSGVKGIMPAPIASSLLRHASLNFPKA